MPPARNIGNDADESDHPSTSRAMSPAAAAAAPPPAKRSKSSLPSTTSSTSRRSSIGGGRQARMEEYVDEKKPTEDDEQLENTEPALSKARQNWRRLGARLLGAKQAPTPSFPLGLFEMKRKHGHVYEISRGNFVIEADLSELCRSDEDRAREGGESGERGERRRRDETGRVRLWPGGEGMALWIEEGVIEVKGRRVMEIGCGVMGLPARMAKYKGAAEVRATDGNEECVRSMERNSERIVVERMEWGRMEVEEEKKVDVILAADSVFFEEGHGVLMETIDSWLREGGEAWMAAPERRGSLQRWRKRVQMEGWILEESEAAEKMLREKVRKTVDEDEEWPKLIRVTRKK